MLAIELRFLAGRYHATSWDHHVNEGVAEWPPSPFRVLRALVAASYRLQDTVERRELAALMTKLAEPPLFRLPPATTSHTRHYMPLGGSKDGRPTTTKVLDAFVAVGNGAHAADPVTIAWPEARLEVHEEALLDRLLESTGYLGRSESWVEARRIDYVGDAWSARPLLGDERSTHEVRLLALVMPHDYSDWRAKWGPAPEAERKGKRRQGTEPPADLLGVLHADTGDLQNAGWSDPPGTRWVRYGFAEETLRVKPQPRVPVSRVQPTVARLVLQSKVLPRTVDTLGFAERIRVALLARSRDEEGNSHPVFLGRDPDGMPMTGHCHAHVLPIDVDGNGRIEEVCVYASMGFDERAVETIGGLTRLWGSSGHDVHVRLATLGTLEMHGGVERERGEIDRFAAGTVWESRTPFVPIRHPKTRGGVELDTHEDQVRAELASRALPLPARIESIERCGFPAGLAWYRFQRERKKGGGARARYGARGFRLHFDEPVRGPILLGYGAHFGLGQFAAIQ